MIFIGIFTAAILAALYVSTIGRMEKANAAESIKLYCDAFVRQDEAAQKQLASYGAPTESFNMKSAFENALQTTGAVLSPEEIRRVAVEATAEAYRELQPAGTVTFYVPVRYNEKTRIWDPADPMQFGFDLSKQTMGVAE